MQDLTIFVSTCDKYSDLWDPFFYCFSKFFNYDGEPIVLTSELLPYSYRDLNIIVSPNNKNYQVSWGTLTRSYLELVKTKYVLFMLDDFFLRRPVNMNRIKSNINAMNSNPDILYFSYSLVEDKSNLDSEFDEFYLRSPKARYKLNTQPCLWRTEDLKKLILSTDNPWDWEDYGTRRLWYTNKKCYCAKAYDSIIDYGYRKDGMWAVRRGKWVVDEIKPFFESVDLNVDYSIRGVYHHVDYRKDSLFVKFKRLPKTIRQNELNFRKRLANQRIGKQFAKENG